MFQIMYSSGKVSFCEVLYSFKSGGAAKHARIFFNLAHQGNVNNSGI